MRKSSVKFKGNCPLSVKLTLDAGFRGEFFRQLILFKSFELLNMLSFATINCRHLNIYYLHQPLNAIVLPDNIPQGIPTLVGHDI